MIRSCYVRCFVFFFCIMILIFLKFFVSSPARNVLPAGGNSAYDERTATYEGDYV